MSTRLLLVEDDETDVLFLKRAFGKAEVGCSLVVERDGRRAVAYLEAGRDLPTHVLLDLKLPEMSGFEVLRWIRERDSLRGLHVAILTSSREASDVRQAQELSAEGYFVKPMSFASLVDIARAVGRWIETGEAPALPSVARRDA